MAIEWFPYHSVSFKVPKGPTLPSQDYSFQLVRYAIQLGKEIVIMRSKSLWLKSVPELDDYGCIELSNPRNPHLSQNQMSAAEFERLLTRLSQ